MTETKTDKMKKDKESWPNWAHKSKREWKRDARKRWVKLRKQVQSARIGCAFYPTSAYQAIQQFKAADKEMKAWFKNA